MPGVTAAKKANLIEKMNKARSMERLVVIPFENGRSTLRRSAADELVKSFATPEMRDKLSDPTIVLVVAGYADAGGRADVISGSPRRGRRMSVEFLKNRPDSSTRSRPSAWAELNFSIVTGPIRTGRLKFG